ncbi:multidrug ABC transporter ATP-binding protein [Salipiger aestuarii]|uniref:ATP-binding cassette subfamily B protein n=1 Tax=Salipiger aestuarii TaxID=568098 RepID=A0A327YKC7_9RHOB|nr:ABC transporter ATP-binding protein [Salipiger aestuarii]EIE50091.1 ABC transporter, transmembrane ATP-binding protein [Citreicella sp. 357]KAA8609881.1 multidrug ABC transporter ATP-binding protein [Salipiger aestuarii]KAA8616193.1 multidrug ABC transporter ATP-binding protein [Salipiger aestuarii]KAB2543139.1 multidrug ABC transporter ATP-binding protein [Salipiger aestuarii]RAK21458.1 ATP-binding cassette subfamily B protein [Salipiger aestuarii]
MTLSELIDPFARAKAPPPSTLWRFMAWALNGAWPVLIPAATFSILGGVTEVLSAKLLGDVIDRALGGAPSAVFSAHGWFLLLCLGFFVLLRPAILGISAYTQSVMMQPNVFNLILSRVHRYTLGHAVAFFDNDFAGRISQKEMQTARAMNDVVTEAVHSVLFAVASVMGSVWLLGAVDWRIAVGLVIWIVAYGFLIRHFMPRIRETSKSRAAARAMVTGQLVDTVTNIKTVKLFAHDEFEDQAALGAMSTYRDRFIAFGHVSAQFRFWLMALAGTLPVLLIGGALFYWSVGLVSAGDIAATGTVALRLAQMTGWVSFTLMGMYANIGEIEDGIRTITPAHTLLDAPDAGALTVARGRIEFRDVGFSYGRKDGGLDRITLDIAPGEKIGVVGASGAGKSTMVALLLRLYDAERGGIFIDGQNIEQVTQESLRRQIGMVTQETAMFNRSALDNIRYGKPDATMDEVIAAAEKAEAHEFIQTLRDHAGRSGYDAHLGERGVKLSGGQRQRIALARAILKDAPILVLDEATSALDSEVEASIQSALERVMQGKTVMAIAHRLSTLSEMDRIIVLDRGRIAEAGTHDALLARNGLYARYWHRQSGGFMVPEDETEAAE